MHIITRKHPTEAGMQFPDAKKELAAWYKIASKAEWRNFVEVRRTFKDTDAVDDYVIFNIRHNRYRLITIIHYQRQSAKGRWAEGRVFIRSVLTHEEYNNRKNWDKGVKKK